MEEVFEFLKECGTYYLATIDGDEPKVRPFGTVDIFENHLYMKILTYILSPLTQQSPPIPNTSFYTMRRRMPSLC